MAHVVVLMATWNGARYLDAQIESLRAQTYQDWELWIRDDGSTDGTPAKARAWATQERRITRVIDGSKRLGPTQSFAEILDLAVKEGPASAYYFFCDQDDVWRTDKIQLTIEHMLATETQCGAHTPVAVHSDLALVGPELEPLHPSAKRCMGFDAESPQAFPRLLAQNFVTGCTLAINRSLAELSLPIPRETLMHDWWLGLLASALGRLEYINAPLVNYRQHGANASGATRRKGVLQGSREVLTQTNRFEELMHRRFQQSQALEERLARFSNNASYEFLTKFHATLRKNRVFGAITGLIGGVRMQGTSRTLAYYLLLLKKGYPRD